VLAEDAPRRAGSRQTRATTSGGSVCNRSSRASHAREAQVARAARQRAWKEACASGSRARRPFVGAIRPAPMSLARCPTGPDLAASSRVFAFSRVPARRGASLVSRRDLVVGALLRGGGGGERRRGSRPHLDSGHLTARIDGAGHHARGSLPCASDTSTRAKEAYGSGSRARRPSVGAIRGAPTSLGRRATGPEPAPTSSRACSRSR
jgi:hypothetical protein